MDYATITLFFLCSTWWSVSAEQEYEVPRTPKPYVFSYSAGRMPGHIDRVHSEVGDEYGTVRGMFSYVDPREQVRTVEYVADQNGFHPLLITDPATDTKAVQNEKAKHYILYNKIAAEHQRVAEERGQTGPYVENNDESDSFDPNVLINHPQDTPVVERAKLKHYDLYNKIALEHARIAAERGDYEEQNQQQVQEEGYVNIGQQNYY